MADITKKQVRFNNSTNLATAITNSAQDANASVIYFTNGDAAGTVPGIILNGTNYTDFYSKNEIDTKINNVTGSIEQTSIEGLRLIGFADTTGNDALGDESTVNTVYIGGKEHTAKKGDVVIQKNLEYIYDGSMWQLFGIPDFGVEDKNETLVHGNTTVVATIKGTDIHVTAPTVSVTNQSARIDFDASDTIIATVEDKNITVKGPVETLVLTDGATTKTNKASNNNPFLNLVQNNNMVKASHQIKGSGTVTVSSDTSGNLTINGKDTNTHDTAYSYVTSSATSNINTAVTSNGVYLNLTDNGGIVRSSHKISGSGEATVTSDGSGNITINAAPPVWE